MVALAVTSIGLLGMASLQVAAMNGTQSSHQRVQAAFLAYDLTDRMRNNRASVVNGDYDLTLGTVPVAQSCRGGSASCSPSGLAAADLSEWRALVTSSLIDGNASIATNTPAGSAVTNVTVTITWADSRTLPGNQGVDRLVYNVAL
jgi:type IV pilus assembly protein PilV